MTNNLPPAWQRREFVTSVMMALGGTCLGALPASIMAQHTQTPGQAKKVQEVIDLILKQIPGAPFKSTVDTIKAGSADQVVKGIVTTMFATDAVIEKTAALGANFIIAHEPTFYNHLDETSGLAQDGVYGFKKNLLQKNGIAVWRFHDHWHSYKPDGIRHGVLQSMGWDKKPGADFGATVEINSMPLQEVIRLLKKQLGIQTVKYIGDLSQPCRRIAILPGMSGGQMQIMTLQRDKPDLLICGELNEWETSEYVRDARYQGMPLALVVTGHALSEEPGMRWLAEWLRPQLPGMSINHVPSGDPFTYL